MPQSGTDRSLNTTQGVLLALGLVAIFWVALGVGLWRWLG